MVLERGSDGVALPAALDLLDRGAPVRTIRRRRQDRRALQHGHRVASSRRAAPPTPSGCVPAACRSRAAFSATSMETARTDAPRDSGRPGTCSTTRGALVDDPELDVTAANLRVGDFDDDGHDESSPSSTALVLVEARLERRPPVERPPSTSSASGLVGGDFDGDGRDDIAQTSGSGWRYSRGGSRPWATLRGAGGQPQYATSAAVLIGHFTPYMNVVALRYEVVLANPLPPRTGDRFAAWWNQASDDAFFRWSDRFRSLTRKEGTTNHGWHATARRRRDGLRQPRGHRNYAKRRGRADAAQQADIFISRAIGTYRPDDGSYDGCDHQLRAFPARALSGRNEHSIGTCGMTEASFDRNTYLRLFVANTTTEVASNDDNCAGRGSQINYVVPYDMSLELHAGCYANAIGCGGTIALTSELDATPRLRNVKAAFGRIRDEGVFAISPDP